jgi:hypothetical protein
MVRTNSALDGAAATFTHGKIYATRPGPGTLLAVTDDLGHTRYIIPDAPCAHLVPALRWFTSDKLGRFETVK